MGLGRKAPREGVTRGLMYPEPWWITNRWWCWMLYRALLGRPMDGMRWTNSTFWRSATEGEDHWWLRLAGWQRALIRVVSAWLVSIVLPALTVAVLIFDSWSFVLQTLMLHLLPASIVLLGLDAHQRRERGVRLPLRVEELVELSEQEELEHKGEAPTVKRWRMVWVREGRRTWEQEVVRPVAAVAAEVLDLGWHPGEARKWVEVPRDYAEPGGHPVEILLPRKFTASEAKKKALLAAVKPRLGMMELQDRWLLQGRHPRLQLAAPPAPPDVAHYRDFRSVLERSVPYRPFVGVSASGELVSAEMVSDSAHIAVSAGSGAGKSMLLRSLIAQALRWGWHVIILDWKVESHEWARGLPGVTYVSDEQALHDMCVRIGEEVQIRKGLSAAERERRPRVLVVREEWNMSSALLAEYWSAYRSTTLAEARQNGEQAPIMPIRSPALTAMMMLDFAGRSFGMHDALIAQRMSNRVFNGNVDIRENFHIRLLARYTVQTWKMLLPHLKYMKKPAELGRWVLAAGDEAMYVQGILMSAEEAQELASGGEPNPPSAFMSSWSEVDASSPDVAIVDTASTLGDPLRPVATGHNGDHPELDQRPAPVILRKLVDISTTLEYLGITHQMLKKAARSDEQGDPDFPPVRGGQPTTGYLYDLAEVTEWARRKRASEAAERAVRK